MELDLDLGITSTRFENIELFFTERNLVRNFYQMLNSVSLNIFGDNLMVSNYLTLFIFLQAV